MNLKYHVLRDSGESSATVCSPRIRGVNFVPTQALQYVIYQASHIVLDLNLTPPNCEVNRLQELRFFLPLRSHGPFPCTVRRSYDGGHLAGEDAEFHVEAYWLESLFV